MAVFFIKTKGLENDIEFQFILPDIQGDAKNASPIICKIL
jgi:hypothetical protein